MASRCGVGAKPRAAQRSRNAASRPRTARGDVSMPQLCGRRGNGSIARRKPARCNGRAWKDLPLEQPRTRLEEPPAALLRLRGVLLLECLQVGQVGLAERAGDRM